MQLVAAAPESYLGADAVVDWHDEAIQALAARLRADASDETSYAERAFEFVRDQSVGRLRRVPLESLTDYVAALRHQARQPDPAA